MVPAASREGSVCGSGRQEYGSGGGGTRASRGPAAGQEEAVLQ